jgi:Plasmid recombination enzyme
MAFAILRVAKLKTMGNVAGHGDHVERIRETLNADRELKNLNTRIVGTADAAADVLERFGQAGIQPRKGAVVAIDVFISASPEHFKNNHPSDPNWKAFQERAMSFLQREYGADNVVHAIAHHDETSPHLHAIVTPIKSKTVKVGRKIKTERTETRLCARDWLGGDRTTLGKLQTRFADHVKDLGLDRGIEGSRAKHTEVKQFYTVMNETVSQAQAISTQLAPIDTDHFVRAVSKPGILDVAQPRQFAQNQVSQALKNLQQQIQQTNHNSELARSGQIMQLQKPIQNALEEKSRIRQSQAEKALKTLGYRLDQHGGLINLEEERINALRATISHVVKNCTATNGFSAMLKAKGIQVSMSEKGEEKGADGKLYRSITYTDDKGPVKGRELGPEFSIFNIGQQIHANAKREDEKRKAYEAQQAELKAKEEARKQATQIQKGKENKQGPKLG